LKVKVEYLEVGPLSFPLLLRLVFPGFALSARHHPLGQTTAKQAHQATDRRPNNLDPRIHVGHLAPSRTSATG
jgi:hypothetical protein